MASKPQDAYARRVDQVRMAIALVFTTSGLGLIVVSGLRIAPLQMVCFGLIAASLLATFGLIIEYLVRSWVELRRGGGSRFSFSLRDLFGLVALTAIPLGMYGWLGTATYPAIALLLIIAACVLESLRIKPTAEAGDRLKAAGSRNDHD